VPDINLLGPAAGREEVSAVIVGQILGADTGLPVPGGTIFATSATRASSERPVFLRATIAKDGRFSLRAVPGQAYFLCVNAGVYLDPCRWAERQVATTAGSSVTLTLSRGVPLEVVLRFDKEFLKSLRDSGQANSVAPMPAVGVFYQNPLAELERPVPFVGASADAVSFFDVIPDDPNGRVLLKTPGVQLADEKGKPYTPGTGVPIPQPPQTAAVPVSTGPPQPTRTRVVTFNVLGLK